jgi:hypothetical protein
MPIRRNHGWAIINDITALREAEENISIFNAPAERCRPTRKPGLKASGWQLHTKWAVAVRTILHYDVHAILRISRNFDNRRYR